MSLNLNGLNIWFQQMLYFCETTCYINHSSFEVMVIWVENYFTVTGDLIIPEVSNTEINFIIGLHGFNISTQDIHFKESHISMIYHHDYDINIMPLAPKGGGIKMDLDLDREHQYSIILMKPLTQLYSLLTVQCTLNHDYWFDLFLSEANYSHLSIARHNSLNKKWFHINSQ